LLGGLAKLVFLAFLGIIGLGVLGSFVRRGPTPTPASVPSLAAIPAPVQQSVPAFQQSAPIPVALEPVIVEGKDDPIGAGQSVLLSRPAGAGNTILAVDKASFLALLNAQATNRLGDFTRLREADKLRGVINGTRATVISVDGGARVMRITAGPQNGFVGWIEAQYVHPDQPIAEDPSLTAEEKTREERQRLIDHRKAKRAARANQGFGP
jgi:hypothetical protein